MRSKIIFLLLIVLSFSIMHDTAINMLESDDKVTIAHYANPDTNPQECGDIHEMHSLFHFVGLMTPYKSTFLYFQKERTLSHNLLQYTPPHKETSYKPPIA